MRRFIVFVVSGSIKCAGNIFKRNYRYRENRMNFKKITMISASAVMLLGLGTPAVSSMNQSQTVKAAAFINDDGDKVLKGKEAYSRLHSAGLATSRMHYTGKKSVKFHWYKTPHVKPVWNNVNVVQSWDANTGGLSNGNGIIMGYITMHGRKYYINDNSDNDYTLENGEDLHRPTIMHGSNIRPYDAEESGFNDDVSVSSKNTDIKWKGTRNFIVPTHHKAVTLPCSDDNKEHQYVPVVYVSSGFGKQAYILKSDFDKLKAGTSNHGKISCGFRIKIWNKKGLAYSSESSTRDFKARVKIARRILKGHGLPDNNKKIIRETILEGIRNKRDELQYQDD